nr:alpha/beta hydrolase fold family protein [uncultured bacterium]
MAGHHVFTVDTGTGTGTPLVLLHGFPGSSFDWHQVVPPLAERRRVVAFDLPGYGLSGKPREARYSLFEQADVVAAVLAACGVDRCVLVAHDMGDTVAAELLARYDSKELPVDIEQVVLTNGSIFIDMARLTRGQRFTLTLPDRVLPVAVPEVVLRRSIRESFPPELSAPPGSVEALIALIRHGDGDRLLPRLIRYVEERRRHQDRWTAGLVEYAGPMTAIWGEKDPIAVVAMARRLKGLRPATEVVTWPDVGHWPPIEAPGRLARSILDRL